MRFVQINKARCLHCGSILISEPETAGLEIHCSCGKLIISGGSTHLLRSGQQGKDYEELSKLSFEKCPSVKEDTQDAPPMQNEILDFLKKKYKK